MTADDEISIGPFVLGEPLGQGGMGVVHRAEHRKTGVAVAMKFLSTYDRVGPMREAFHREVQLVAGLTHPGIVEVLDYGTVGSDEVPPHAAMKPGDPWLAMELARGGSLADVRIESWDELRWVLLHVLDALAHAHARGVVHRDLKPGNILIAEHAGRRVVQLADFGIAHLRRESAGETEVSGPSTESAGTPHYMAPEQIRGDWRNFGSWTDLYALGCVAYRLATGRHVFSGGTPFMIWDQHLNAAPPSLRMRFTAADGFEAWVRRLLSKHPRDRFRRAADAAWVLRSMPQPTEQTPSAAFDDEALANAHTLVELGFDHTQFDLAHGATLTISGETAPLQELLGDTPTAAAGGRVEVVAPMPDDWRLSEQSTASAYADVGLGLLALRGVQLIGREAERDALWSALTEVRSERRGAVVVLRGAAGVGKSALGRWFHERAHEVAGASVLRVTHDVEATASTGLLAAVDRYVDGESLERFELWERLRELMSGRCDDPGRRAAAMTEVLRPGTIDDRVPAVVMASSTERWISLRDGLSVIVGARPLVLWIDDAHLGSAGPTLEAVSAFVARNSVLSTVAVVARRELDEEPLAKLEPLYLDLGTVDDDTLVGMLRARLPISERAALTIVERAEGVPLFAMHLLDEWARSGRLVARDRGFEVDNLQAGSLPRDIEALWRERFDRFVTDAPQPQIARRVAQVAATLGRDVQLAELDAACDVVDVQIPYWFADALIRQGLVTPRRGGFSFTHSMLAQTIAETVAELEAQRIHAACASAIAAAHDDHGALLRVARHRLRAGEFDLAIDDALASIELSWADDRAASAGTAIEIIDEAATNLGLPDDDRRVVHAQLWRTRGFRVRWDFAEVEQLARALLASTTRPDLQRERAEAQVELGLALGYSSGELERALPHFEEAVQLFESLGETKSHAEVLSRIAYVLTHAGKAEVAVERAEQCVALYRDVGDPDGLARGLMALAQALSTIDQERVEEVFEEAAELSERAGLRYWQANVLYGMANLDEQRQRYETAIDRLRESAKICAEIGSTAVDACRVNLACLLVLTDRDDEAALLLRELEQRGTLPQLWRRARYAALVLAERAGNEGRATMLRTQIEAEPVDDPTAKALFERADRVRAS